MRYFAILICLLLLTPLSLTAQEAKEAAENYGSIQQDASDSRLPDYNLRSGAVFVMTNRAQNGVIAFARERSGHLMQVGHFQTGGAGDPTPRAGADTTLDPLASQGSLVTDQSRTLLFACNAGSDSITVFRIGTRGLYRLQTINSGGVRPISIAVADDLVYVLNEGRETPSIAGFRIGEDLTLTPINDSVRVIDVGGPVDAAQIGFSPDADMLVITDRANNLIYTFEIELTGRPGRFQKEVSNASTPSGFAFGWSGDLFVAEAHEKTRDASSVSSYDTDERGSLKPISRSVRGAETGACCIAINSNERFAFVLNSVSGTISSYRIAEDGTLTLLAGRAAELGPESLGIEMAMSHNGRYLYVVDARGPHIIGFSVARDGTLKLIGGFGLMPSGIQGIAAR